jgi:hypothetical protein
MSETLAGKPQPEAIPLNIYVGHKNFSFFCSIFWGTQKREAAAPKAKPAAFWEGTAPFGRTGKAEAAKCIFFASRMRDRGRRNLARSRAQKMDRRKGESLLNWKIGAVSAEQCEQVKRNRKNQSRHDRHRFQNGARFEWHLRR